MSMSPPFVFEFGKHKGQPITRVPLSYLKWIANEHGMSEQFRREARAEIRRRGTVEPEIEVSAHAIDRASLRLLEVWQMDSAMRMTNGEKEGLHSWLVRKAQAALAEGTQLEDAKMQHDGIVFVFEAGACWPVLKSAWLA